MQSELCHGNLRFVALQSVNNKCSHLCNQAFRRFQVRHRSVRSNQKSHLCLHTLFAHTELITLQRKYAELPDSRENNFISTKACRCL